MLLDQGPTLLDKCIDLCGRDRMNSMGVLRSILPDLPKKISSSLKGLSLDEHNTRLMDLVKLMFSNLARISTGKALRSPSSSSTQAPSSARQRQRRLYTGSKIVLMLDDIHTFDTLSLALLVEVASSLTIPFAIIATHQPLDKVNTLRNGVIAGLFFSLWLHLLYNSSFFFVLSIYVLLVLLIQLPSAA